MQQQRKHGQHQGKGAGGTCVCPKCRERIPHKAGVPCQEEKCPKCGAKMLREGSYHYQLWKEKQQGKEQAP